MSLRRDRRIRNHVVPRAINRMADGTGNLISLGRKTRKILPNATLGRTQLPISEQRYSTHREAWTEQT